MNNIELNPINNSNYDKNLSIKPKIKYDLKIVQTFKEYINYMIKVKMLLKNILD